MDFEGFWERSGSILGGIWEDLGKIWKGLGEIFFHFWLHLGRLGQGYEWICKESGKGWGRVSK